MPSETGKKVGGVVTLLGIGFAVAGLLTDEKGLYAFIGVLVLFIGRFITTYF